LAGGVHAVDLKPVLGEIRADGGNLHGGRLILWWRLPTATVWHSDAGEREPSTPSRKTHHAESPRKSGERRFLPPAPEGVQRRNRVPYNEFLHFWAARLHRSLWLQPAYFVSPVERPYRIGHFVRRSGQCKLAKQNERGRHGGAAC